MVAFLPGLSDVVCPQSHKMALPQQLHILALTQQQLTPVLELGQCHHLHGTPSGLAGGDRIALQALVLLGCQEEGRPSTTCHWKPSQKDSTQRPKIIIVIVVITIIKK